MKDGVKNAALTAPFSAFGSFFIFFAKETISYIAQQSPIKEIDAVSIRSVLSNASFSSTPLNREYPTESRLLHACSIIGTTIGPVE